MNSKILKWQMGHTALAALLYTVYGLFIFVFDLPGFFFCLITLGILTGFLQSTVFTMISYGLALTAAAIGWGFIGWPLKTIIFSLIVSAIVYGLARPVKVEGNDTSGH